MLGIRALPGVLEIEVDLTFARDHPDLLPPRQGDTVYGRVGLVSFHDVTQLTWEMPGGGPALDASGEADWGAIDSCTWAGQNFVLEGDFGQLSVIAGRVDVELTGPV